MFIHYEDFVADPKETDFHCPDMEDNDDWSGHPAFVTCPLCRRNIEPKVNSMCGRCGEHWSADHVCGVPV